MEPMKRAILVPAALALLLGSVGQVNAGLLTSHSTILIEGEGSGLQSIYFNTTQTGDSTFLSGSGSVTGNGNGLQSASAIVHTDPSPLFLGGQAASTSDGRGNFFAPPGGALAAGA